MSDRPVKTLYFDLETSPNLGFFWRPGYKLSIGHDNIVKERAIICVAWKWAGEDYTYAAEWDDGDDRELIREFLAEAMKADELIAHNGDHFDIKWLNGRVLMHGMDPTPVWRTTDTLKIAKKHFNLNSNRLDYLARILLGEGKDHTSFGMWKDIVLRNDPVAMQQMVEYCRKDVVLLERVHERLSQFGEPNVHAGVNAGLSRWTCPHCASEDVIKSKTRITKKGMTQHQMQCKDCGRYYSVSNLVYTQYVGARAARP